MLIRAKPLKLHTGMGLSCGAEGFSERIQGNYGLLGAHIASKDLLFLMTEPPEDAEPQAGMTVLVDQSGRQDTWNVTMDVVNNVVNRILLDGSERFTYQDQVYITTVLNRLGITDTERFMTQVRQLRTESESTAHLLTLYQRELARLRERREAAALPLRLPLSPEEGGAPAAPPPDVELSLTILRRLDAVESVQRLYELRRSWFYPANYFQRNELHLSEQLRFGGSVSLEETKRQVFQNARLSLVHHLNRYELEEAPEAEGEGPLSRAAAATLSGAVDNVLLQILNRPELRRNQWLHLEHALWQSGSNSLARFTLYHEAPPPAAAVSLSRAEETVWNRYAGELREYQTLRQYLYPRTVETVMTPPLPGEASMTFLPVSGEEPEGLPVRTRELPDAETVRREVLRETDSLETARERLERFLKTERRLPPPDGTPGEPMALRHVERTETAEELRERVLETDRRQTEARRLERMLREQKIWPPAASIRERALRLEREIRRQESRETSRLEDRREASVFLREREIQTPPPPRPERREPGRIPPVTMTAREAEELAPALLEEAVREIDRRNRTMLQSVPPESRGSAPAPLPVPDLRRTLKDSLRALSEPETLLREITEKRQAEEAAPLALTHREEMLLRQLPAEERKVYEAVLAYGKDPEGTLAGGVLRPGSLGELYGAVRQAERPAAELAHPAPPETAETERITERVETVLERFLGQPPRQERRAEAQAPPPGVKLIHKTAEITEEEREEQRRTQTTVRTDSRREEIRRHEERQVDVTRQERTLVSEAAEDITALVNRTLAGQMKTISDQVYRQMEKRLQMERSRRGRL